MIIHDNGRFSIVTGQYACFLNINRWGLPELLYFGPPVPAQDAGVFSLQQGLGWGTSVLLEQGVPASCPDAMALAWSGSGRGDYRESPLNIRDLPINLRYQGYRILEGIAPMEGALPQAKGDAQTLELLLCQPGLKVKLYFTAFETAMTRRVVVENIGKKPLEITKLMSSCLDLPGELELTSFHGGWIAEMQARRNPVNETRLVIDSSTGFSSHRHNPGFLLSEKGATEDAGRVYGFNLVYSGNHYSAVQRSLQGLNRVVQGMNIGAYTLVPGAVLETPEAVMTCSDQGFGGQSEAMHRFVNGHIVPAKWQNRSRPVLFNSWEGCMFDFNQAKLLKLAKKAKRLGCELFVLDDGWFGKRNNDRSSLGDYTVNKKKLPLGIKGLAKQVNQLGMGFGLWFEPESVSPDSDLYRAHPDWALDRGRDPLESRNQLLLDLTKPQVRDYIVQQVSRILDSAPISYVKWDMNRHSSALGARAHAYILGLYEVLGRIFGPRPQILLESCSSGGNRFDLGMLCFGPQIWCSDNTDPVERRRMQESLSYLYPQSTFGAHVSAAPHAQTLRATPFSTRGHVAFFGCLGYELNLKHLVKVERKEIRQQIALYKAHRMIFQFGTFRRLEGGFQVSDPGTCIAGLFYGSCGAAPGYEWLRLKGLQPNRVYALESVPKNLRIGPFGNLVKHVALGDPDPNGFLLRTADKNVTLPDGDLRCRATGAAFMAGIPLLPRFRGTGYDQNQRTQLDYGSDLFILTRQD